MLCSCRNQPQCCSGSLEPSLKDSLRKFANARRYDYWSQYVKSLVCHVAEMEEEGICYFSETQMLFSAWRMLLILSTGHVGHVPCFSSSIPTQMWLREASLQLLQPVTNKDHLRFSPTSCICQTKPPS